MNTKYRGKRLRIVVMCFLFVTLGVSGSFTATAKISKGHESAATGDSKIVYAQRPDGGSAEDHILYFPEERSLGTVYVRDAETRENLSTQVAQGAVAVPAGALVTLAISEEGAADLSPLSTLDPTAIRGLTVLDPKFDESQLRHIESLSSLTWLNLSQTNVSDDGLRYLSDLVSLKSLNLSRTLVTGTGLAHLKGLTSLEQLYLDGTSLTNENVRHLDHLQSLTDLSIGNTEITYVGAALARQILPNCRINTVFPGTRIDRLPPPRPDLPARTLHFPEEKSIGKLYGDGNKWNKIGEAQGTIEIPAGISVGIILTKGEPENVEYLKNFTGLDLQEVSLYFTESTNEHLNHLNGLTGLELLSLAGCNKITDEGFALLQQHTSLRSLDCMHCPITDKALESLSQMKEMQYLNLRGTKITGSGFAHLSNLASLKTLDLSSTPLAPDALAHIGRFTSLEELFLTGNALTNDSLSAIGSLVSLRELSIHCDPYREDTSLDDDALIHLKNLTKLESFSVFRIPFTGSGLIYLRDLPALRTLRLPFANIQDEHTKQFKFFPALALLDLWRTPLTDKSIPHFKHLTSIYEIRLHETNISPAASASLQLEFPPYSHVNTDGGRVNYLHLPASPLTETQAAKLAATIANNTAERYRGIRPFSPDDYPAYMEDKLWVWGSADRASQGEFTAEIKFSNRGGNRSVDVYEGSLIVGSRRDNDIAPSDIALNR